MRVFSAHDLVARDVPVVWLLVLDVSIMINYELFAFQQVLVVYERVLKLASEVKHQANNCVFDVFVLHI